MTKTFFSLPPSRKRLRLWYGSTELWLVGVVPEEQFLQTPYVTIRELVHHLATGDVAIGHQSPAWFEPGELERTAEGIRSVVVGERQGHGDEILCRPTRPAAALILFTFRRVTKLMPRLFSRYRFEMQVRRMQEPRSRYGLTQAEAEDFVRALYAAREWLTTAVAANLIRRSGLPEVL